MQPPEKPNAAPVLDVKTERDTLIRDGTEVVRVFYRRPPTRRWTKFLLVPDEGQTVEELEEYAADAASCHEAGTR